MFSQTICHATSKDLIKWEKNPNNPILKSDPQKYETKDWRDPYVFWNEDEKKYWMLLTARPKSGSLTRLGCVVLAVSDDLQNWEIDSDFWCPNLCICIECPDLFRWDDKWYLMWSKFSKPMGTFYRIGENPRGPWHTPLADKVDGKYFYAAKTAGDGSRRFAFAWIPIRLGEWDDGYWEWGGDLVIPHELIKQNDGTLKFRCPPEIVNEYSNPLPLKINPYFGEWKQVSKNTIQGIHKDGFGGTFIPVEEDDFLFEVEITLENGTKSAGILLKTENDMSQGYMVRFDSVFNRVVIDHWPVAVDVPWRVLSPPGVRESTGPSPLVEQPICIEQGKPINCKVFINESTIQVFAGDSVALSYRIFKTTGSTLGLFIEGGIAKFEIVRLSKR